MKVVITGGMGFVGQALARSLLKRATLIGPSLQLEPIDSLVIVDALVPTTRPDELDDRVTIVGGDISDRGFVRSIIDRDDVSIFHLASMVSAGCEADFDGALAVNLDGTRTILEACRALHSRPRVVFSSSSATFGGEAALATATDATKFTPETTYGTTKAMCELLVNDYTRKGFLDGRSARLPTVVIRPGRPNAAASSWVSGIFREPLNGEECVVPVDPSTRIPLSGHRTVVNNLVGLHDADGEALGRDRGLNLPSLSLTAMDIVRELGVGHSRPLGRVRFRPDPFITAIYRGWASTTSFNRATALGLQRDEGIDTIIRAYLDDFLVAPAAEARPAENGVGT